MLESIDVYRRDDEKFFGNKISERLFGDAELTTVENNNNDDKTLVVNKKTFPKIINKIFDNKGDTLTLEIDRFLSTSISQDPDGPNSGFAKRPILSEITVPSGTNALFLGNEIFNPIHHLAENELLFAPEKKLIFNREDVCLITDKGRHYIKINAKMLN